MPTHENSLISFGATYTMESCVQTGVYHIPRGVNDNPRKNKQPKREFKFIGLYKNKIIRHVGEFEKKVLRCNDARPEQQDRIRKCIRIEKILGIDKYICDKGETYDEEGLIFYLARRINPDENGHPEYFHETHFELLHQQQPAFQYFNNEGITRRRSAKELAEFLRCKQER